MTDPMIVMTVGFVAGSLIEAVRSMLPPAKSPPDAEDAKKFELFLD